MFILELIRRTRLTSPCLHVPFNSSGRNSEFAFTHDVHEEMFEPLTPSTMCVDRRLLSNPITQEKKTNDNLVDDARKRERFLTRVLNHFLEHWRKEYLTELREQHKVKNGSQMIRSASETLLWFMKIKFLDSYGKSVEFEI